MEDIGRKRWAIAEGYIPPTSTGPHPRMTCHETICLLNAGRQDAHVEVGVIEPPYKGYDPTEGGR